MIRPLVLAVALLCASCSPPWARDPDRPPLRARINGLSIEIPNDVWIKSASVSRGERDDVASFTVCARGIEDARPVECGEFDRFNSNPAGVRVNVFRVYPGNDTWPFVEHPGSSPIDLPSRPVLLATSNDGDLTHSLPKSQRASRLSLGFPSRAVTTVDRWPIANCGLLPNGKETTCVAGFLHNGAFVR